MTILSTGVPGVQSMGPDVAQSVQPRSFADLTYVTLAVEDSNPIPTDDVNRAILDNVAMQVAPPGHQVLVAKIGTNASDAI